MCVSCHQAEPLKRLGIQRHVSTPSVTLAGVLQHESLGICAETCRIDRTVIGAIETRLTAYVGDSPVGDAVIVNLLVEDTLNRDREGE